MALDLKKRHITICAHAAIIRCLLGQPEINIDPIPPVGVTQALVRLIGRPHALKYLYNGKLVPADEALVLGMVDILHHPDELHNEVQAYAESLARKPAKALAAIRRTISGGGGMSFDDGLKVEFETAAKLAGTKDFTDPFKPNSISKALCGAANVPLVPLDLSKTLEYT